MCQVSSPYQMPEAVLMSSSKHIASYKAAIGLSFDYDYSNPPSSTRTISFCSDVRMVLLEKDWGTQLGIHYVVFPKGTWLHLWSVSSGYENWLKSRNWVRKGSWFFLLETDISLLLTCSQYCLVKSRKTLIFYPSISSFCYRSLWVRTMESPLWLCCPLCNHNYLHFDSSFTPGPRYSRIISCWLILGTVS